MQLGTGERSVYSSLSASLKQIYQRVRPLFMNGERDRINVYYEAGQILAPLGQANRDYGPAPVAKMAAALSISLALIRQCILVASTISQEDLTRLLREAQERGFILAWGHLVELSKVDSVMRPQLAREMFINRLKVYQLNRERMARTFSSGDGALTATAAAETQERREFRILCALWDRVRNLPNFRPLNPAKEEIRNNIFGDNA